MKRVFIVIIILLLLSVTFFIMSGNGISYQDTTSLTKISPYAKDLTSLVKLYFIDDDQLVSESRNIKIERFETERAIVEALKTGSKIEAYKSPIHSEVRIGNVETLDRVCYVDLSPNFLESDDEILYLNVMAIVNSLTDLESIDYVQILIGSKKTKESIPEIAEPIARNILIVQSKELEHKDIVRKFFDYINLGRYDLAYDMIDSESKILYDFDDFRNELILIRNEIKGSTIRYIFAIKEEGTYHVQVKFVRRVYDSNKDIIMEEIDVRELDYSFPVKMEDGIWKVVYKNF